MVPGIPSTPRYAESGASCRGSLVNEAAWLTLCDCQPRLPETTSPGANEASCGASHAPSVSPGFRAWVQGLMAEASERIGHWSAAEAHYRKALAATPDANFLPVAHAAFLPDRLRAAEVLPPLAHSSQPDTAYPPVTLPPPALP